MNKQRLFLAFILALGIIIFLPSLKYGFAQDDFIHLSASHANSFRDFLNFFNPFIQYPDIFFYRPLGTQVYFFINQTIFGLNPLPFRIEAIVIHLLNSLLFFLIVKRITKNNLIGIISTFFYTISASHFLSLYYISAFQQILKTFFVLSSIVLFFKYQDGGKLNYYLLSILTFIGGLLSKETAVIFPLLLFPLTILKNNHLSISTTLKKTSKQTIPYFFITLVYLSLRVIGFRSIFTTGDYSTTFSFFEIFQNLKWYLIWSLGLPEILSSYPSLKPSSLIQFGNDLPFGNLTLTSFGILICLILILILKTKIPDKKLILSSITIIIVPLLPVLVIYQHRYPHYLDLSYLGLFPLLSYYLLNNLSWRKIISVLTILSFILVQIFSLQLSQLTHWSTHRSEVSSYYFQNLSQKYPILPVNTRFIFSGTEVSTRELSIALAKGYALSIWYPNNPPIVEYKTQIEDRDRQDRTVIIYPITKF